MIKLNRDSKKIPKLNPYCQNCAYTNAGSKFIKSKQNLNINFNYILKERLKIQEEWLRGFLIAKKHDDIDKEADKSYYKEKPILSLLLAIYFFPTNLLRFVSLLRAIHIYHKCKSQVEVLKKEVEKTNK